MANSRPFFHYKLAILLLTALAVIVVGCSADDESAAPAMEPEPTSAPPAAVAAPTVGPTAAPEPPPTSVPDTPIPASEPTAVVSSDPAAPELEKTGEWINSEPFTLSEMQEDNRVVLIDFWTYTCINCIRTLPFVRAWHEKYADHGLVILGVHTPEFEFEKEYDNVLDAVKKFDLKYPVVQDNDFGTWQAFNNRYWPAKYLIDHDGRIRYSHFGEGAYDETELVIRDILTEAGYDVSEIAMNTDPGPPIAESAKKSESPDDGQTRELYAGYERNYGTLMSGGVPPYVLHEEYYQAPDAEIMYTDPGLHRNHFLYLHGLWINTAESLDHARETMDFEDYMALKFFGTSVNVVMSPGVEGSYDVVVFLDDAPIPPEQAGRDIMYDDDGNSYVAVDDSRVYHLVDQDTFSSGELRLTSNSSDFSVFAFTFGSYEGGEPIEDL